MPISSISQISTPGSIVPLRVPITRPSSAVNPIVDATLLPSAIAHIDAPLPRCATTTRPAAARMSRFRIAPATYSYDRPWKP